MGDKIKQSVLKIDEQESLYEKNVGFIIKLTHLYQHIVENKPHFISKMKGLKLELKLPFEKNG